MKHKHNLNHWHLTTMNMGQLIPISCVEVLHGDRFRHAAAALLRFSPLLAPVMHPLRVSIHHWYVPNRILWAEWEGFMTGADSDYTFPTVSVPEGGSSLLDHLGVPQVAGLEVNALPVRAYNMIVNEKYFDQDIDSPLDLDQLDIQFGRWEKDYFSTARPESQQGEEVQIPFSTSTAPVYSDAEVGESIGVRMSDQGGDAKDMVTSASRLTPGTTTVPDDQALYADLTQATGGIATTDFRVAMALQRFKEARSRYGSRYSDYLRYYGVRPSDGRLQMPEYLGGGRQTVAFSEVLATADGGASLPVGSLKGHGIASVRTRPYRRFFEEHGHVISIMCVRPKAIYMNSLNRNWLRRTKEDYWQRELEIVGQQPVSVRELYAAESDPDATFGWVDRYLEYRGQPSIASGDFRNSSSDFWHVGRDFSAAPGLNSTFLECNPTNRIFADTNQPQLYCMTQQYINARRFVSRRAR